MAGADGPGPRDTLLRALVDHLLVAGVQEPTLRELARAVGSSHRMLLYHFGSREGLLAAVVEEVERRQLEALSEIARAGTPRSVMMAMHRRLTDPRLAPLERLFFELYARGLAGDPAAAALFPQAVESWVTALTDLYRRFGFPARQAAAEATLALATSRGLLLDLLATGDRARVDAAARAYVAGVVSRLPGAGRGR